MYMYMYMCNFLMAFTYVAHAFTTASCMSAQPEEILHVHVYTCIRMFLVIDGILTGARDHLI